MGISSHTMTMAALDEYAETLIARRISMVSGVAQVQVYGAKKYAVRVQADPDRLAARQVGLEDIRDRAGPAERQSARGLAVRLSRRPIRFSPTAS